MLAWESERLLGEENSVHYCSGGAGIAGRHGWCTLEVTVELFLLLRFLFERKCTGTSDFVQSQYVICALVLRSHMFAE